LQVELLETAAIETSVKFMHTKLLRRAAGGKLCRVAYLCGSERNNRLDRDGHCEDNFREERDA
jgi:hypothetical protein